MSTSLHDALQAVGGVDPSGYRRVSTNSSQINRVGPLQIYINFPITEEMRARVVSIATESGIPFELVDNAEAYEKLLKGGRGRAGP